VKAHEANLIEHFAHGYMLEEAKFDRESGIISNVALLGAVSANKRRYSAKALQDAVQMYPGTRMFIDHPTSRDLRERKGTRSIRDMCGKVISARLAGSQVRGDIHIVGPHKNMIFDFAESIPELMGHSHRAKGRVKPDGSGGIIVEGLGSVQAVELVTEPATTHGLFESVDTTLEDTMDLSELTEEQLRSGRPDLVKVVENKSKGDADAATQIATMEAENKTLREENDAMKVAQTEAEHTTLVDTKLAESKLTDRAITDTFREQLQSATDAAAIDVLIEDRQALLKTVSPRGPISRERNVDALVAGEGEETPVEEAKIGEYDNQLFS